MIIIYVLIKVRNEFHNETFTENGKKIRGAGINLAPHRKLRESLVHERQIDISLHFSSCLFISLHVSSFMFVSLHLCLCLFIYVRVSSCLFMSLHVFMSFHTSSFLIHLKTTHLLDISWPCWVMHDVGICKSREKNERRKYRCMC